MYKVFINDHPIIFTSSLSNETDYPVFAFDKNIIDELLHKFKEGRIIGVVLFADNLEQAFSDFFSHFKVITAGGGLVLNPADEILFIYRNDVWDLPKGRIEKGESIEQTAIREVEEECGISNLSIDAFLLKTYHIFYWDNQPRIKQTYWYLMHSDYTGTLTPQLEEGITEVCFKSAEEIPVVFNNTYANIKCVYQKYKDL